jgi:iron(II)-dependent oxidoreductase
VWSHVGSAGIALHADTSGDPTIAFAASVARGLSDRPRWLDCRYLYDDAGSQIFEEITRQPEYYQTRTENAILAGCASELRQRIGPSAVAEIGSGSSAKTKELLRAWCNAGPTLYVPIDINQAALVSAARELQGLFPTLSVEALAASYDRALPLLQALSPLTLLFLGSSIGNLSPGEIDDFFALVARSLAPDDFFLLGIDLVKGIPELEAAYNDAAGWSARFAFNIFARMNRELGASIPLEALEYVAFYNDRLRQIEMYARFRSEVVVEIPPLRRRFRIAPGEMILTEVSRKFEIADMVDTAARFGFSLERPYRDGEDRFAVLLLRRGRDPRRGSSRKASLQALLREVRQRTMELIAPLSPPDIETQFNPLMSPILWDLGHIANYEEMWLVRALGVPGIPADLRPELDPLYNPISHPRAERGSLPLPDLATTLGYLGEVRDHASRQLGRTSLDRKRPLTAGGYVVQMVAQHEAQHQETIAQALQLREDLVYGLERPDPPRPASGPAEETLFIPAGPFLLGSDDRNAAYDNERPRHLAHLPAFEIDAAPVTNQRYLDFMRAGGYRRRELWTEEGWAWRTASGAVSPAHWRLQGRRWWQRFFGRHRPIDPLAPVLHVSWFEAAAFARWAGRRLPTEAEWEKAAAWDADRGRSRLFPWGDEPPTERHANLDRRHLQPVPVGSYPAGRSFFGCEQMIGDVWEWTQSDFLPYPGFEAFPYREYSEVFFGNRYRVLRGGSFATLSVAIRNTFRNWDLPQRRQIFAGFRCAIS